MIEVWNENMVKHFSPGWFVCIDESMMAWVSKYTCPGWICVPRKSHPFCNKFHTAGDGVLHILFQMELVEGKDEPEEKAKPQYSNLGKTVGLLMCLAQTIYNSGRVIILDSGFCVLAGLLQLLKKGLYASAVVKKGGTGQSTSRATKLVSIS